jgi:ribosomal protein L11 methyltransferase
VNNCFELTFSYPDNLSIEDASYAILGAGIDSLSLNLINKTNGNTIVSYFSGDSLELNELVKNLKFININLVNSTLVEDKNWILECMEMHSIIQVEKVSIVPVASANDIKSNNDKLKINLIPGYGFGTGHHESTQIALKLMQSQEVLIKPPSTFLDIGTGSGILAIALCKIFSASGVASDNDPLALINAKENLEINQIVNINLYEGTVPDNDIKFDCITANLYSTLLIKFKPLIKTKLNSGGFFIFTGVQLAEFEEVLSCYISDGFKLITKYTVNDWIGALLIFY